jgi:SAM-dependent methyltransferase
MIGGWDLPEVAAAQHALVTRELIEDATAPVGPYAAFRWAMDTIGLERGSLLDVGCGSGHYGVLCERFYPRINYYGTDVSDHMTVYARGLAPLGKFSVCEFRDNKFSDHDIVLASQVLEVLDFPFDSLDTILLKFKRHIILNRIRTTAEPSHRITEGTYVGNVGRNWLWNLDELTRFIEVRADIVARNDWATGQCTFVVKRRDDESAKLCGCTDSNGPCDCAAC